MHPSIARRLVSDQVFNRRLDRGLLFWLLLILGISLTACQQQPEGPVIDHMAVAKKLEADLKASGKEVAPDDPVYEQIIQELALVPSSAADKQAAEDWSKELKKAQHRALMAIHEEPGGSYPSGSEAQGGAGSDDGGDEGGAPAARPKKSAGATKYDYSKGSFVAGVWTPYHNVQVNGGSVSGGSKSTRSSTSASSSRSGGSPSITIYTASWCGVCKKAKAYMKSKGIAYTERDVEKDSSAKAEVARKTGGATGVPVLDVGGEIMVGFDQNALDEMIARH